MIVSLTGTIEQLDKNILILNVRGIGYELGISSHCYEYLLQQDKTEIHILTRFIVKEDTQTLYGFYCHDERLLFDKLCSVSGVGPKLALSILSTYTTSELYHITRSKNENQLNSIVGVGKKMAARLLVELTNIFESYPNLIVKSEQDNRNNSIFDDLIDALIGMGFARDEVLKSLKEADDEVLSDPQLALMYALKQLGGGSHVGSRS